jgi:hypothetical protein
MFEQDGYKPIFLFRDPLVRFFNKISRHNAALLTNVTLQGHFLRGRADQDGNAWEGAAIGFARLLPIYTCILKEVCPNLRKLTVHTGKGHEQYEYTLWDDDLAKQSPFSYEEKVDRAIQKVVQGLPGLQELQLGKYSAVPENPEECEGCGMKGRDEWGKALRWMAFVRERAEKGNCIGGLGQTEKGGTSGQVKGCSGAGVGSSAMDLAGTHLKSTTENEQLAARIETLARALSTNPRYSTS